MAVFSFRHAAPSLAAVFLLLGHHGPTGSPLLLRTGTDVFGSGTGGLSAHQTTMYAPSGDASGWGISNMKPETPPAPPPAATAQLPSADFGREPIGVGDIRGGGVSADGYGVGAGSGLLSNALKPLGE